MSFLLLVSGAVEAAQTDGPPYPELLAKFDIRGVRLGMIPSEVLARLHEIDGRAIRSTKKLCADQRVRSIKRGANPDYDTAEQPLCIASIAATLADQAQITVGFTEDLSTKATKATSISYSFALNTVKDRQEFFEKVKQRYGPPTAQQWNNELAGVAAWVQYECGLQDIPLGGHMDPCHPLTTAPYAMLTLSMGTVNGNNLTLNDGAAVFLHDVEQRKLDQAVSTGNTPKI